jgi:hypothetical protein
LTRRGRRWASPPLGREILSGGTTVYVVEYLTSEGRWIPLPSFPEPLDAERLYQ